jgi:ATP-dependent helicase HrpB
VSAETRIEVITEGILTRMIQDDPALEDVACVVFDEFHERSLNADLGLALALDAQAVLRPELRILLMSATLEAQRLGQWLPAPVVSSAGFLFPVETHYLDPRRAAALPNKPGERLAAHGRCAGFLARRGRFAAHRPQARRFPTPLHRLAPAAR